MESFIDIVNNIFDNEGSYKEGNDYEIVDIGIRENGWYLDNELNLKSFLLRVVKLNEDIVRLYLEKM